MPPVGGKRTNAMSKSDKTQTRPAQVPAGAEADRLARIFGGCTVKFSPLSCPILKSEALAGGRYLRLVRLESARIGENAEDTRILVVDDLEAPGTLYQLAETYALGAALDRGTLGIGDTFRLELLGHGKTAAGRTVNEYKFDKLEVIE